LTGLLNRQYFLEIVEQTLKKEKCCGVLMYLDLDNFKVVNDSLGHASGDRLLKALGQLFTQSVRPLDYIARIGGDEFTLLLQDISLEKALHIAERLLQAASDFRFCESGMTFGVGLSIGVVEITPQHTVQDLLAQADGACYTAKSRGRNRIEIHRPQQAEIQQLAQDANWMVRIKDALHERRFKLWFQPVISLKTLQVDHYVALIRLFEQDHMYAPAGFIGTAERFGLIRQIDQWVIEQAMEHLAHNPTINIAVNLSAKSFNEPELKDFIIAQFNDKNVQPQRLSFEITETAAVVNLDIARSFIGTLKDLGCHFALDDFGVGFSSFASLRELPVDRLKIDGSFIRGLASNPINQTLVRSMQQIAKALDKTTIAEFVEDAATLQTLRHLGIAYGQGYFLGKPSPDFISPQLFFT